MIREHHREEYSAKVRAIESLVEKLREQLRDLPAADGSHLEHRHVHLARFVEDELDRVSKMLREHT